MIQEALQYFASLARGSNLTQELEGLSPRSKTFIVDGKPMAIGLDAPPRNHKVHQLSDVVAIANRFNVEDMPPVVWYDETKVVVVFDDGGHRIDTATFDLDASDVFAVLIDLRERKQFIDQKAFVRLLRIDLAGTLPAGILLDRIRKIQWSQGATTSGVVGRGTESLGREISAKVDATGEVPEEVTLEVPVYSSRGQRHAYGIRCSVEIEPLNQVFRFMPMPDEIERVQQLAVESIEQEIGEALEQGVNYYYGSP